MSEHEKDTLAVIEERILAIKMDLERIEKKLDDLDKHFVSHDAFAPVQKLAYGMTGAFGMAIMAALATLIFKK